MISKFSVMNQRNIKAKHYGLKRFIIECLSNKRKTETNAKRLQSEREGEREKRREK